jgi:FkbM family methyltransferase
MPGEIRYAARHHEILAVVDDALSSKDEAYLGFPLISTDTWLETVKRDPSIVTLLFVSTVRGYNHFLQCMAQNNVKWLGSLDYFRIVGGNSANIAGTGVTFVYGMPFFRHAVENMDAHLRCAELFADDFSRFTLFSMLNYRLTANPNHLARCAVGLNNERFTRNSYIFNRSFFNFSDNEVFVDGGAFDGDSIEQFLRAVRGRFRRIHAFEPSAEQAAKCEQRVRRLQSQCLNEIISRVSVTVRGLWSSSTRLSFNPNLFAADELLYTDSMPLTGHVLEGGFTGHMYRPEVEAANAVHIDTTTVDEACGEAATFIKLEIEGSELEALRGASRTIARMRPKMSLAIYHKPEDFLTLTEFVRNTKSDYRMSLRQHNPFVPDATVCYCY